MATPTTTIWTPNLKQDNPDNIDNPGNVYFENTDVSYNIYALNYATTFKLLPGTFTIPSTEPGAGRRDTDIPASVYEKRQTLIGVIPLFILTSNNQHPDYPIRFSFPANNFAVSVEQLDRYYYVIPQSASGPENVENEGCLYKNPGADDVRLPYRHMLLINGVYDASGAFRYGQNSITVRMEMKQAATPAHFDPSYNEKKILVPLTISKSDTDISLRTFTGVGSNKNNSIPNASGEIVREWLDGGVDLNFADFAQTNRVNIQTGEPDYGDIEYYISLTGERTFVRVDNDKYIQISGNRITFLKSTETVPPTSTAVSIPIRILQEETPVYNRSNRIETRGTIRIIIKKSIQTFVNQIPDENTDEPTTIYRLPDLNKMTTEGSFRLVPPESTNREPAGIISFSSSNESLLKIRVSGDSSLNTIYTAFIYGSGTAIITVSQASTDNFHQKVATFAVNIFEITPAIINCNTNLFYTNPYNRQFWTRFKPECRSSNMVDSVSRQPLTISQVDEVYDMRRKAEILKYNKNVGGLTKNQKYAKASRGELMRNIGNSTRYISDPASPFALICPPTAANSRLLCGLTTACGVPGRERVLCYDPSVNLYNYKRTYQYEAGLQATINIPTTILTEPKNFRVTYYDNVNKRVTLMWDAPDSNGGFPITGYVITYSVNNKTWAPYKSVFPYKPVAGGDAPTFNEVSGEINGNSVIFERIPGSIEILDNTVYYLSVFSGNERGLSSVPATLTLKTSSVPSIINDFGFTNAADERQNLMVDLKWTEPTNTGSVDGGISGYNGPPVNMYHLYYRKVPDTTWIKKTIDLSNVIIPTVGGSLSRRYVLRDIENKSKYQIKIEPINSVGVGPESAIITARTLMAPGTPLNIVLSPKFALLPPIYTDSSGNYINITWNKPDTGGSIIKYYNITITPPPLSSLGSVVTYPYNIASNDTRTSYSANFGILNNNVLVSGSYSVVMETNNGYLPSVQSAVAFVTIDPLSAKPSIFNIEGYYVSSGLVYAELTFSIPTATQPENTITNVIVNGFTGAYQTTRNSDNQEIAVTGEHKFRIPASSSGREIIIVGTQYFITITLVYQNGEKQTSEVFSYTPDIRYLNV